jgi:hypothetical protein
MRTGPSQAARIRSNTAQVHVANAVKIYVGVM